MGLSPHMATLSQQFGSTRHAQRGTPEVAGCAAEKDLFSTAIIFVSTRLCPCVNFCFTILWRMEMATINQALCQTSIQWRFKYLRKKKNGDLSTSLQTVWTFLSFIWLAKFMIIWFCAFQLSWSRARRQVMHEKGRHLPAPRSTAASPRAPLLLPPRCVCRKQKGEGTHPFPAVF